MSQPYVTLYPYCRQRVCVGVPCFFFGLVFSPLTRFAKFLAPFFDTWSTRAKQCSQDNQHQTESDQSWSFTDWQLQSKGQTVMLFTLWRLNCALECRTSACPDRFKIYLRQLPPKTFTHYHTLTHTHWLFLPPAVRILYIEVCLLFCPWLVVSLPVAHLHHFCLSNGVFHCLSLSLLPFNPPCDFYANQTT